MDLMVILRQLWNQRRSYGWILAELVVVTYFLWSVIDPVYVLMANKALPECYDINDTYLLRIGEYPENHAKYNPEVAADSIKRADFMRIVDRVRRYPGVSRLTITKWNSYPQSMSWYGSSIGRDTTLIYNQYMVFMAGTDYFDVFRIHENGSGRIPPVLAEGETGVYITPDLAEKLFPEGKVEGKEVYRGDTTSRDRVVAVVDPFRSRSNKQPSPLAFVAVNEYDLSFPWGSQICFRVGDGMSSVAFTETMKRDLRSQLQIGNYYLLSLADFNTISRDYEYSAGVTSKLRLQTVLAIFFILCTFLGMGGTFWVQCNTRRSEMGLYMAMGSSRRRLICRFLSESWWLVTIAFFIGVLVQIHMIYVNGFAFPTRNGNPDYWQNQPVTHFLIVSALTYILILGVSLLATFIPVVAASKMRPTDTLRDE